MACLAEAPPRINSTKAVSKNKKIKKEDATQSHLTTKQSLKKSMQLPLPDPIQAPWSGGLSIKATFPAEFPLRNILQALTYMSREKGIKPTLNFTFDPVSGLVIEQPVKGNVCLIRFIVPLSCFLQFHVAKRRSVGIDLERAHAVITPNSVIEFESHDEDIYSLVITTGDGKRAVFEFKLLDLDEITMTIPPDSPEVGIAMSATDLKGAIAQFDDKEVDSILFTVIPAKCPRPSILEPSLRISRLASVYIEKPWPPKSFRDKHLLELKAQYRDSSCAVKGSTIFSESDNLTIISMVAEPMKLRIPYDHLMLFLKQPLLPTMNILINKGKPLVIEYVGEGHQNWKLRYYIAPVELEEEEERFPAAAARRFTQEERIKEEHPSEHSQDHSIKRKRDDEDGACDFEGYEEEAETLY